MLDSDSFSSETDTFSSFETVESDSESDSSVSSFLPRIAQSSIGGNFIDGVPCGLFAIAVFLLYSADAGIATKIYGGLI